MNHHHKQQLDPSSLKSYYSSFPTSSRSQLSTDQPLDPSAVSFSTKPNQNFKALKIPIKHQQHSKTSSSSSSSTQASSSSPSLSSSSSSSSSTSSTSNSTPQALKPVLDGTPPTITGKPRVRKFHSKSRKGCVNCKQSRIKCDELKPTCTNCSNKHKQCVYTTVVKPVKPVTNGPKKNFIPLEIPGLEEHQQRIKHEIQQQNAIINPSSLPLPPLSVSSQQQDKTKQYHLKHNTNNLQFSNLVHHPPLSSSSSLDQASFQQQQHQSNHQTKKSPYIQSFKPLSSSPSLKSSLYTSSISSLPPLPNNNNTPLNPSIKLPPLPPIASIYSESSKRTPLPPIHSLTNSISDNAANPVILPKPPILTKQNSPVYGPNPATDHYTKPPSYYPSSKQKDVSPVSGNNNSSINNTHRSNIRDLIIIDDNEKNDDNSTNNSNKHYKLYKTPRNVPKIINYEGLPYEAIIDFFQNHVARLMSQQNPSTEYLWRYVIPQLAFDTPLLSNSIISFTALIMKRQLILSKDFGESLVSMLKNLTMSSLPLSCSDSLSCDTNNNNSTNSTNTNTSARPLKRNTLPDLSKRFLNTAANSVSTVRKLEELSLRSYSYSLKRLIKAKNNIKNSNTLEIFLSTIIMTSYSFSEGTTMVSRNSIKNENLFVKKKFDSKDMYFMQIYENNETIKANPYIYPLRASKERALSTSFRYDSEDEDYEDEEEDDKEEEEEEFSPTMLERLPDMFEVFKTTCYLITTIMPVLCDKYPDFTRHPTDPNMYFVLDNFYHFNIYGNTFISAVLPLLKQIIYMYKGNVGLCDEITKPKPLSEYAGQLDYDEKEKEEDLEILKTLLKRIMTTMPADKNDGQYYWENGGGGGTELSSSSSSQYQASIIMNDHSPKYYTWGPVSSVAFCEPPKQQSPSFVDPSNPFYLYPGELEACCLMVYVTLETMAHAERASNPLIWWSIFRDAPEVFLNFARMGRPLPIVILITISSFFEATQWFIEFVLLKHASALALELPEEWLPALARPICLFDKAVKSVAATDCWVQQVLQYREMNRKQQQ